MVDDWDERAGEIKRDNLRQNIDDLNNEVAGRDTGRIKRFVQSEAIGSKAASQDDDADFVMNLASQILTEQQQRRIERLQRQFELYDQATTLALQEIDEEIALAETEYRRIQDNATVLQDGRRVYRDETSGHFYDEQDQRVSSEDEIEASANYSRDDSSRQALRSADMRLDDLHKERKDVIDFQEKQNERELRLKDHPEEVDEIEQEMNNSPVPDRVRKHHDQLASSADQEIKAEASTSVAKNEIEGSIESEIALMPAFRHAAAVEQVSQQPDIQKDITPASPGMALG